MNALDGGMGRVQSRRKVWRKRCFRSGVAMLQTSVDIKSLVPIVWADRKARVTWSSSLMVSVLVARRDCYVMVGRKVASPHGL